MTRRFVLSGQFLSNQHAKEEMSGKRSSSSYSRRWIRRSSHREEFVKRGTVDLTAISRSGVPPEEKSPSSPSWTEKVHWVAADSTKPDTYAKYLRGVSCVVTSIGVLPFGISEEECFNGNAQTNIIPAKTAQHLHVNRFVAVGASLGFAGALPGVKPYVEGKIAVENFAKNEFVRVGESSGNTPGRAPLAVIVKPGGISGTKSLGAGKMNIPLWILMDPMTFIMKRLGKLGLENSPVRVERAKAVVRGAFR